MTRQTPWQQYWREYLRPFEMPLAFLNPHSKMQSHAIRFANNLLRVRHARHRAGQRPCELTGLVRFESEYFAGWDGCYSVALWLPPPD